MTDLGHSLHHDLPPGFHYREDFVSEVEEQARLEAIADITFSDFEMRGVVARRRVAFFGESVRSGGGRAASSILVSLPRQDCRVGWRDAEAFAMALINEYRPGTPIGWHRDSPQYDVVAGISLLSACRMKFRTYRSPAEPKASRRSATHEIALAPRSRAPDDPGGALWV